MKIAMFTNTYLPHVGGVARAVRTLENACREDGHEVRVVAPEFKGFEDDPNVLRVPAIQNFNGSDFSVRLPFPNVIRDFMEEFQPDLVHSHHPFLLGDAALREAWKMDVPIVFTHHTLYERYTHYVPLDSPMLKRVAIQLATEYCNLCDRVVAPSESIERLLLERGVTTPINAIPTGIDVGFFASGNGARFRETADIPPDARVIGHVGRLALEKNLTYLVDAVAQYLRRQPDAVFLIVGDGDARDGMMKRLADAGVGHQVRAVGKRSGQDLADAYCAMDCFVFASQTETQGLVIAEAMAAGNPVIALDGPGVREIVRDGDNGTLLAGRVPESEFAAALDSLLGDKERTRRMAEAARGTAEGYSTSRCARRMLDCYMNVIASYEPASNPDPMPWDRFLNGIEIEWELFVEKMSAAAAVVAETPATEANLD
jgi:1,2-diacylglycerol 3-alpha-glucosyltransferase